MKQSGINRQVIRAVLLAATPVSVGHGATTDDHRQGRWRCGRRHADGSRRWEEDTITIAEEPGIQYDPEPRWLAFVAVFAVGGLYKM